MSELSGLRIAQVTGANSFGGVAVWILPWCRHLVKLGSQVTVQSNDPRASAAVSEIGARAERISGIVHPIRPVADAVGVLRLAAWMRANHFDILHTHTSKGGFLGRLAGRMAGVPVVIHTQHNLPFHEHSARWKILFYSGLERAGARCCDRVVCVSREQAAWISRLGIGDRRKVIPIVNAVEAPPLPSREQLNRTRASLGLDNETPVVFCAGRLCAQKNYGDMLRAMKYLLFEHPSARLLIAGEGPLAAPLERQASELGVAGSVRFLGFRKDVADLMAAADVVAFSSLWEGMPLAMLEAMALAKPVVANAIMGIREVIRDGVTGLLVAPRKPEEMAAAIARLLADPAWAREIGLNARRQATEKHSMPQFLQAYEAVYRELVQAKMLAPAEEPAWQEDGYMVEYRRR